MATKKKTLITMAEYSRKRGCSRPYITKLVQQGIIGLTEGMIDPVAADLQIADYAARYHDSGARATGDPDSLTEWRKRELMAKTALKQLQLSEEEGLLLRVDDLKAEFAKLFTDLKTTLRGVPSKIAGEVYHTAKAAKTDREGMGAISTLLLKEIDAALTELSRWQPKSNKEGGGKGKKIGPYKRR